MKGKFKRLFPPAFSKLSRGAVFCLTITILSIVFSLVINRVLAVSWQGPTANPPNLGNVEPPINTSTYNQEKEGGLIIASGTGKKVGIGNFDWSANPPQYLLDVAGNLHATGFAVFDSSLTAGVTTVSNFCVTIGQPCLVGAGILHATENLLVEGNTTLNSELKVGVEGTDLQVLGQKVYMRAGNNSGVLNVGSESITNLSAIYAQNASASYAAIQGVGTDYGVYGLGNQVGVFGGSDVATGVYGAGGSSGYGVWGSGVENALAGVYGEGSSTVSGVIGKGRAGIIGVDSNGTTVGSYATTLAGWFKGNVLIQESSGTPDSGDLTVDGNNNTFIVDASTNRVGIGTLTPSVKLEVVADGGQAGIYSYAGNVSGTGWGDGPTATVTGVYGGGGNASGSWNYGIYGKAGTSSLSGITVGVQGVTFDASQSYAGYFRGPVYIANNSPAEGSLTVQGTLLVQNTASFSNNVTITGTTTMNNVNVSGTATLAGDLLNSGGLYLYQTGTATCVPPTNKDNGTMYVCKYCAGQTEYTTLYVYLDNEDGNGNNDWIQVAQNTKSIAPNNCSGGG